MSFGRDIKYFLILLFLSGNCSFLLTVKNKENEFFNNRVLLFVSFIIFIIYSLASLLSNFIMFGNYINHSIIIMGNIEILTNTILIFILSFLYILFLIVSIIKRKKHMKLLMYFIDIDDKLIKIDSKYSKLEFKRFSRDIFANYLNALMSFIFLVTYHKINLLTIVSAIFSTQCVATPMLISIYLKFLANYLIQIMNTLHLPLTNAFTANLNNLGNFKKFIETCDLLEDLLKIK